MTLEALLHLLRSAAALADDCEFIVLGSASLLVSFPELGRDSAPLTSTYDADLCPLPFDELTGRMLEQALGESQAYYQRHGYHADILRDTIFETLPEEWHSRLLPIPNFTRGKALEPHDLAAVKLFVGRPKDLKLVAYLITANHIRPEIIRDRIEELPVSIEKKPKIIANWRSVMHSA